MKTYWKINVTSMKEEFRQQYWASLLKNRNFVK